MEDSVDHQHAHRRRVRVRRKRTLWERTKKFLEMPHLKRHDRNQRLAIAGVIIMLVVYLLVLRPLMAWLLPPSKPKQVQIVMPAGKTGLRPTSR